MLCQTTVEFIAIDFILVRRKRIVIALTSNSHCYNNCQKQTLD